MPSVITSPAFRNTGGFNAGDFNSGHFNAGNINSGRKQSPGAGVCFFHCFPCDSSNVDSQIDKRISMNVLSFLQYINRAFLEDTARDGVSDFFVPMCFIRCAGDFVQIDHR